MGKIIERLAITFLLLFQLEVLPAQTRSTGSLNTGNTATGNTGLNRGGAGNFATGNNTQAAEGIDAAAGSSENINRDFGNGFVGRGDTADRFVGNQQAGPQQLNQQGPNFRQRNSSNVQGGEVMRTSKVRPRIMLSPDLNLGSEQKLFAASPPVEILQMLNQQLQSRESLAQLQVFHAQEGTITLRGTVISERDLKLAEALLRLDPAVRRIEQQVIILSNP